MPVTVRDLMSVRPVVMGPDETVQDASRLLLESGAPCVCVVDDDRRFLGLVTDYDLIKVNVCGILETDTLERVMTRGVATAEADGVAETLVPMFREARYQVVPVLDNGCLAGVLTRLDIVGLLFKNVPNGTLADVETADLEAVVPAPRYIQTARLPQQGQGVE